ncbi:MAG TPA: RsmD family RNA methyltransferase [Candidatus Dormibacteraeota bacterium]|nr:RsmD family RNA methyltransferase [Candidatus Dormibacteraeota bacterium]
MRIISGKLKGQTFSNTSNTTHPMSEKIRGGLFNILGDIKGLTLLDCYAGTGAIAFEAISRGVESAIVVESNKKAQKSIINNIESLKLEAKVKLISASVSGFINNHDQLFDLVVCDPPFDQPIDIDTILKLESLVKPGGLLILSLPTNSVDLKFEKLSEIKSKIYSEARLVFFR